MYTMWFFVLSLILWHLCNYRYKNKSLHFPECYFTGWTKAYIFTRNICLSLTNALSEMFIISDPNQTSPLFVFRSKPKRKKHYIYEEMKSQSVGYILIYLEIVSVTVFYVLKSPTVRCFISSSKKNNII